MRFFLAMIAFLSIVQAANAQSAGTQNVDAQNQGPANQGPGSGHQHPPGPPPNVVQALSLLDEAKAQSSASAAALITQAETLLKTPPHHPGNNPNGRPGKPPEQDQDTAPQ